MATSPLDTASDLFYKHDPAPQTRAGDAQVAQLVEQGTENPRVGGSNPSLGTISPQKATPRSIQDATAASFRCAKADIMDLRFDRVIDLQ